MYPQYITIVLQTTTTQHKNMPNENLNIQPVGIDVNDLEAVLDFDPHALSAVLIESSSSNNLAVNLLSMCNNCDCCARHQLNRPAIYEPWVELDIHLQDEPYDPPCGCSCRHVARWVCRHHPDNPDSPSPILDEDPEQPNCPPPQD
jgi:hypothetical protein